MAERNPYNSVLTPDVIDAEALAAARAGLPADAEPSTIQPQLMPQAQHGAALDAPVGEDGPTMMAAVEPPTMAAAAPTVSSAQAAEVLGIHPADLEAPTAMNPPPPEPTDYGTEARTEVGRQSEEVEAARAMMRLHNDDEEGEPTETAQQKLPPMRARKMTLLGVAPQTDYAAPSSSRMPTAEIARSDVPRPLPARSERKVPAAAHVTKASAQVPAAPLTRASAQVPVAVPESPRPGDSAPRVPSAAIPAAHAEGESEEVDVNEAATREMALPEELDLRPRNHTMRIAPRPAAGSPIAPPDATTQNGYPSEPHFARSSGQMPVAQEAAYDAHTRVGAPMSRGAFPIAPQPIPAPPASARGPIPYEPGPVPQTPASAAPRGRGWMILALLSTTIAFGAIAWIVVDRTSRRDPLMPDPPASTTAVSAPPTEAPSATATGGPTASATPAPPAPPDISDLPDPGVAPSASAAPPASEAPPPSAAPSASAAPAPVAAPAPAPAPKPVAAPAPAPKPASAPAPKPAPFKPVPKPPAWKPAKPPPTPKNPYG